MDNKIDLPPEVRERIARDALAFVKYRIPSSFRDDDEMKRLCLSGKSSTFDAYVSGAHAGWAEGRASDDHPLAKRFDWQIKECFNLNEKLTTANEEIKRLREALAGLLSDTQHSEHNCKDKHCPVKSARAALADAGDSGG